MTDKRKRLIARQVADIFGAGLAGSRLLSDSISRAGLRKKDREWAIKHLNWTLIDEETGEDLLQDADLKAAAEKTVRALTESRNACKCDLGNPCHACRVKQDAVSAIREAVHECETRK